MKVFITILLICIMFYGSAQKLTKPEIDSCKYRLGLIAQRVDGFKCITQGDAKELQQFLADLFATIARKEKEDTLQQISPRKPR